MMHVDQGMKWHFFDRVIYGLLLICQCTFTIGQQTGVIHVIMKFNKGKPMTDTPEDVRKEAQELAYANFYNASEILYASEMLTRYAGLLERLTRPVSDEETSAFLSSLLGWNETEFSRDQQEFEEYRKALDAYRVKLLREAE